MYVAKIRSALVVKGHPRFQAFDFQVLEVDVAAQVQGVEILDAHGSQQAIDLAEFLAALRVIQLDAEHLHSLWRDGSMKLFDVGANAVFGERVFDLTGHIAIHKAKLVGKKDE